jgi:hypothetical protein
MKPWYLGLLLILCCTPAAFAYEGPQEIGPAWVWTVQGDYKTIKSDVLDAIQANGLVVSYEAHAANMLARTAEAVDIVLCPYGISLYSLVENPTEIFVSIRLPALEVAAYSEVHNLLEKIISEALEWYQ